VTTTVQAPEWSIAPQASSFGRMVNPGCLSTDCISPTAANLSESFQTVNNVSTANMVETVQQGNRTFAYLREISLPPGIDFVAPTVAVTTQCTPITTICNLRAFTNMGGPESSNIGPDMEFNCSSGFRSNPDIQLFPVGPPSLMWQLNHFQDANLSVPIKVFDENASVIVSNPVYSGIAAVMDIHGTNTDYPLYNDREIVHYDSYGLIFGDGFVLRCKTETYQAEYIWANGTFRNFTNLALSNENVSSIVNGRFQVLPATDRMNLFPIVGLLQLINGGGLACLQNSAGALADVFATIYSQASLGGAAGVFTPTENIKEWTKQMVLLTRIPFAPFYVLVFLNAMYATIGLLLGVVSVVNILGRYSPGAVQAKLSVWGLVDHAFQSRHLVADEGDSDRSRGDTVIGVDGGDKGSIRFRKFYPQNEPIS